MCSYEKEVARLQKLFEEVQTDEEAIDGEDLSDNEEDILLVSDHYSNSEQSAEECTSESEDDLPLAILADYLGRDKTTRWSKKPAAAITKTKRQNIIKFTPGPLNLARSADSPLASWKLFFPDHVIDQIVNYTNIYLDKIRTKFTRERDAKYTDQAEMKALLGLLYLAGVMRSSHLNLSDLWCKDGTGIEFFSTVMSEKRFRILMRCIRFDNVDDRAARRTIDKLAPIRIIFDNFVRRCQENYAVGLHTTIDEMLLPFRGRCSFRQYISNKPAKYGVKVFSLVDSETYYTLNMEIYAGQQPDGPYQLDNSATQVVHRLVQPIVNSARNVTMDNWYTSIPLVKELLQMNLTVVGTLRKNKRELPPKFVDPKNRPPNSSLFGFQDNLTLVSYIPRKGKTVNLLSSQHLTGEIDASTGDRNKPVIITYYNHTKGGVDKVDEMCGSYSVSRKTARWPLKIFFGLLNIATINSQVIFVANTSSAMKRRNFIKTLAQDLCRDYMRNRLQIEGLPRELKTRIRKTLGMEEERVLRQPDIVGRCAYCDSKKNRKTSTRCKMCSKHICKEHTAQPNCCFCEVGQGDIDSD